MSICGVVRCRKPQNTEQMQPGNLLYLGCSISMGHALGTDDTNVYQSINIIEYLLSRPIIPCSFDFLKQGDLGNN